MSNSLLPAIKQLVDAPSVKERIENTVEDPQLFKTTLLQLANDNYMLQKCSAKSIVGAALAAEDMGMSIHPSLKLAYVTPYGSEAKFQVSYVGLIQLAINTGLYKRINASEVYEDEIESYNPLTGEFTFKTGGFDPTSSRFTGKGKPIGYYAHFELLSGYSASVFMTTAQIESHALQYSKAYQNDKSKGKSNSPWSTAFSAMAKKTVLRQLLDKYAPKASSLKKGAIMDENIVSIEKDGSFSTRRSEDDVTSTPEPIESEHIPEAEVLDDADDQQQMEF